jgi:glycosyltransferase involved in cell wall biosynthesis
MQYKFVYVGRLDKEKGLEDICFTFEKILSEGIYDVRLDLFGQEGNCSQLVTSLASAYPDAITYHGRQDKSIIQSYRQSCHYVLMPSHFLETFGLACLDAYRHGKPVIGQQK